MDFKESSMIEVRKNETTFNVSLLLAIFSQSPGELNPFVVFRQIRTFLRWSMLLLARSRQKRCLAIDISTTQRQRTYLNRKFGH
jgi:hypothetical protein